MPKDIIEITNNINDIPTLKDLKNDLMAENVNIEEIINKYMKEYQLDDDEFERINVFVNFGFNRNLDDFKKRSLKLKPLSSPQNYRETVIKAKGKWKNIYEIAFGSNDTSLNVKIESPEKAKQMVIKETA